MTLDEAAEALGVVRGLVPHMYGRGLERVKAGRRVCVREGGVVAMVQSEEYRSWGGKGPSPAYQWMIGEKHAINRCHEMMHDASHTLRMLLAGLDRLSASGRHQAMAQVAPLLALASDLQGRAKGTA